MRLNPKTISIPELVENVLNLKIQICFKKISIFGSRNRLKTKNTIFSKRILFSGLESLKFVFSDRIFKKNVF